MIDWGKLENLKPCKKCGGRPKIERGIDFTGRQWIVWCPVCQEPDWNTKETMRKDLMEAMDAWNRRAE